MKQGNCGRENSFSFAMAVLAIAILALVGTSCKHVDYSVYQGTGVVQGKGGTLHTIDDVDVWDNGTPNRSYMILGVAELKRSEKQSDEHLYKELRKQVHKHEGNAAIIVSQDLEGRKRITKAQIIRYEP